MSTSVKYGLILGGVLAALPLIFYSLGLEKNETLQNISMYFNIVLMAVIIFLGIKEFRDKSGNGFITFGKGFSMGMVISIVGGAISAVFSYLYFTVINPGMVTYIRMMQEQKMIEKGMSESEVEKMADTMAMWSTPTMMASFSLVGMIIMGLVITLICAGILKRRTLLLKFLDQE
ncbi:MAG: DUF4199 domain-containing protein [Bacteroidetes bacterium]|nr:DUF4199 domain-containing protein [Bacteroidota bacterium]